MSFPTYGEGFGKGNLVSLSSVAEVWNCLLYTSFISVEGGDGSGKSTQMQKIEAYLTEMGQEILLTREPGGTPMAEKIREMILDPANRDLTGRAEMLLYRCV